nr:basic proline-rich protein-like [Manis javanica]
MGCSRARRQRTAKKARARGRGGRARDRHNQGPAAPPAPASPAAPSPRRKPFHGDAHSPEETRSRTAVWRSRLRHRRTRLGPASRRPEAEVPGKAWRGCASAAEGTLAGHAGSHHFGGVRPAATYNGRASTWGRPAPPPLPAAGAHPAAWPTPHSPPPPRNTAPSLQPALPLNPVPSPQPARSPQPSRSSQPTLLSARPPRSPASSSLPAPSSSPQLGALPAARRAPRDPPPLPLRSPVPSSAAGALPLSPPLPPQPSPLLAAAPGVFALSGSATRLPQAAEDPLSAAGDGHAGSQRPRPRSPPVRPSRAAFRVAGASQASLQRSVVPLGEDGLGSHEHQVVVQSHWTIAGPSRDCGAGDTDPHLPQCVTMSKSHCVRAPSSRKMKKMRHRE